MFYNRFLIIIYFPFQQMTNMEERYKTHTNEIVVNKQTEILRANKVIREVGRRLGSDWRYIFKYLMAGFPKEVIDIEYEKVERAKPFIQVSKPYIVYSFKGTSYR